MSDALLGARLARKYGSGGSHMSATVVTELSETRSSPLGRAPLLKFLADWDAHSNDAL